MVSVPEKKDKIKVIRGEFKDHIGQMIGIDSADGIVKMDINLDIKILDMSILARYVQPEAS